MAYGNLMFKILLLICIFLLLFNLYSTVSNRSITNFVEIGSTSNKNETVKYKIGILNILEPYSAPLYKRAMGQVLNYYYDLLLAYFIHTTFALFLDTVKCYASIHGYENIVLNATDFRKECTHKDKFFRRHCITALYLQKYDWLLFIDADIGVANPKRKIEEFIDPDADVTFYDRFINQEIMAGSMLLKNTSWTLKFLTDYADYETKLPKSFTGSDNGALHLFLATKLFPTRTEDYEYCIKVYNHTRNYPDLFVYESCIRALLGAWEKFPHIRILSKGNGWARDARTTNSFWDPNKDFMFHEWKQKGMIKYFRNPPKLYFRDENLDWYDPTIGAFHYDKCVPGNTTWNHDPIMILNSTILQKHLYDLREKLRRNYYSNLGKILNF